MNVLVCNNFVRGSSGVDAATQMGVRALRQHGHRVRVFGADNASFDRSRGLAKARLLANCLYSLPARNALLHLLAEERYDVAHVHNTVPLLSGSIYDALHKHKVVTIQHLHNFRAYCLNAYAYRLGEPCDLCQRTAFTACTVHRCYHDSLVASAALTAARLVDCARGRSSGYAAHAFIASSVFTKAEHVRHGLREDSIWVLNNPCEDLASLLGASVSAPIARRKRLTFVGSLLRAKGVYAVLDLAEVMQDWEVHLIGAGPEEVGLRHQIAARRLRNVSLRGQRSGVEKARAWQSSFVSLAPSLCAETFGLVVPESYSLAIPVLSTGSGGMAETVHEGATGFIQNFRDPAATAALLRELWKDEARYASMRRTARRLFETDFTEQVFGDRLMQLQSTILERYRPTLSATDGSS